MDTVWTAERAGSLAHGPRRGNGNALYLRAKTLLLPPRYAMAGMARRIRVGGGQNWLISKTNS